MHKNISLRRINTSTILLFGLISTELNIEHNPYKLCDYKLHVMSGVNCVNVDVVWKIILITARKFPLTKQWIQRMNSDQCAWNIWMIESEVYLEAAGQGRKTWSSRSRPEDMKQQVKDGRHEAAGQGRKTWISRSRPEGLSEVLKVLGFCLLSAVLVPFSFELLCFCLCSIVSFLAILSELF